jgi:hypothetical protein
MSVSAPIPLMQAAHQYRFWRPLAGGGAPTSGIRIQAAPATPANFYDHVVRVLDALYHTDCGHIVLDELVAHAGAGRQVTISSAMMGNACASSEAGMNRVAVELYPLAKVALGAGTRAAFGKITGPSGSRFQWLADHINLTPRYKLAGEPDMTPCNIGVTAKMVQEWMEGRKDIWDYFSNDPALCQIKNGIIVALDKFAERGPGASPAVLWKPTGDVFANERPPAVGLAHELIHAYYTVRGEQPGWELENATTVLFEYKCVGLGPWAGAPVCENRVRSQWWDAAVQKISNTDHENYKAVGARRWYSPPSA